MIESTTELDSLSPESSPLTHDTLSDEEVVSLTLHTKSYFEILIQRYESKMRRYIRRISSVTDEDTDDLLQEIFIKTYIHLRDFNTELSFSSWIYRIAHNETISFFRKKKIRPSISMESLPDDFLVHITPYFDEMSQHEKNEIETIIKNHVDALNEQHQHMITLFYFEHKSYDEISDIMMIPVNTVASRLKRAREQLKKLLLRQGFIHE